MNTYWDVRPTEPTPSQPKEEVQVEKKEETSQAEESVSISEATAEIIEVQVTEEVAPETTPIVQSETDYIGKRLVAYRQNSLDLEDIQELVMEYIVAVAADDVEVVAKYKALLNEIHSKRQQIKQQFPKS